MYDDGKATDVQSPYCYLLPYLKSCIPVLQLGSKLPEDKDPLCDPSLLVEHLEKKGCQLHAFN